MHIFSSWKLAATVLPIVVLAVAAKIVVHAFKLEALELNALFSAVIGAAVFLIGFMISGTLSDFKESERLPSDLAASLYSIADESQSIQRKHGKRVVKQCNTVLNSIASSVLFWMRNKNDAAEILTNIDSLNEAFISLEPYTETTFLSRLKTEQNQVRRLVLRMQTIRETSFIGTAYAIAEVCSIFLIVGLIFAKGQPYGESLFFVGFITFILAYMIALITDLDNPFNYSNSIVGDEVSLKPLEQFRKRL